MKVTREMIGAAHDICLKKGDFVLSAALLERIYLAMDALANHAETSGSLSSTPAAEPCNHQWIGSGMHPDHYRCIVCGDVKPRSTPAAERPDHREVMKMALVMLELCNKNGWMLADYEQQMYAAITALKEALK